MTDYLNKSESAELIMDRVKARLEETWGSPPAFVAVAPGRVNVIGEHVDYYGGWVLPAAIERYMVMAVKAREDNIVRVDDANFPGAIEFTLDEIEPDSARDWSKYIRGVLAGLRNAGYALTGFDAYMDSTIPVGGATSMVCRKKSARVATQV